MAGNLLYKIKKIPICLKPTYWSLKTKALKWADCPLQAVWISLQKKDEVLSHVLGGNNAMLFKKNNYYSTK